MNHGQTKYSQVLPGTIFTNQYWRDLRLRNPIVDKYDYIVDELKKKLLQTVIGDFIYKVNMTKTGTNRHQEVQEKTIEEQLFL